MITSRCSRSAEDDPNLEVPLLRPWCDSWDIGHLSSGVLKDRSNRHIYTEMVWLKGLLHMFKSWCNFQKMKLIQFWWVKHFLQCCSFETDGSWVSLQGVWHFLKKWCYFETYRSPELLWEECYIFKGHSAYFDTILFLLFKLSCSFCYIRLHFF